MELQEAQIFRMLTELFGRDQVFFRMSALTVCGGGISSVPNVLKDGFATVEDLSRWAASETCLFTVVDQNDAPKLVVEFAEDFSEVIDPILLDHQRIMPTLLSEVGVRYVVIAPNQLAEMLDPGSSYDILMMLEGAIFSEVECCSEGCCCTECQND
jgi:hypothetical protein